MASNPFNLTEDLLSGIQKIVQSLKWKSKSDIVRDASVGDLVEFNMKWFGHYGVYAGDGKVIHVINMGDNDTTTYAREETLEAVCSGAGVRISNHDDVAKTYFNREPRLSADILGNARSYVVKTKDDPIPYNWMFHNCEYYATLWRYGKGFSTQVADPTVTPNGFLIDMLKTNSPFGPILSAALPKDDVYKKYNELEE